MLTLADFGFTDPHDVPANNFLSVKITTVPTAGSLQLTGFGTVTAGMFVTAADIMAGKLSYVPGLDGNGVGYASFTFQVRDDGGTAGTGARPISIPRPRR